MKGRSTTVIGVRVPDSLDIRIKELAEKQGVTVNEWCKGALARAAGMILATEPGTKQPSNEIRKGELQCSP
ncbi:hypothetical protein ES708_13634 [subsurface metagenome]